MVNEAIKKEIEDLIIMNGYLFKPYSGTSGRSRYEKDFKTGIVFFFTTYKEYSNNYTINCVVRKRDIYLETIFDEVILLSQMDQYYIKCVEDLMK